ncbi:DUF4328 domain-containing protein [Demequina aurantiaca]|uniref:DUF4328 domain-containing protein n=1 Tax=Demequina aurantiaca TaxID=676200 RepID=UPI003D34F0F5
MTVSPALFPPAPMRGVPAQRGLGIAVLVATGLFTLLSIATAISPTLGYSSSPPAGSDVTFHPSQAFGLIGVIAWLLLAQWMATAARGAAGNGYPVKHKPWVAWWGWAIPVWSLWAPYRYMKDATQGFPVRNLGLWWIAWLVGTVMYWSSDESTTIDGVTTQTQVLVSAPLNAIALTLSWVLLARIVWTVSQGSGIDSYVRRTRDTDGAY